MGRVWRSRIWCEGIEMLAIFVPCGGFIYIMKMCDDTGVSNLADEGGLLREFAQTRSQRRFGRLMERHVRRCMGGEAGWCPRWRQQVAERRLIAPDIDIAEDAGRNGFGVDARRFHHLDHIPSALCKVVTAARSRRTPARAKAPAKNVAHSDAAAFWTAPSRAVERCVSRHRDGMPQAGQVSDCPARPDGDWRAAPHFGQA